MKTPPPPQDEAGRLATLRQFGVLDTPPESVLDELTTLASRICETPIALISLVDEHRQWFKARTGWDVGEIARDDSFCTYAIHETDLMVVPDTATDPRFLDGPLVTGDPRIRFYAGAPLIASDGHALGTLCVMDRVPRELTAWQREALRILSHQVMAQLELRRQAREVHRQERLLSAIFDGEPECLKLIGPDGSLRMMNRAGLTMIEADSFEEVAGRCIFPLVVPEHRSEFEEITRRAFLGETGTAEFRIVGLKGATRWLETRAAPLRDEDGTITAMLGITRDITARRLAEEASRFNDERFQIVARSTNDAIWDWDPVADTVWWNEGYQTLFGYPPSETDATSASWTNFIHPEDADRVVSGIHASMERGESSWMAEYRFRRRDGTFATVLDRGTIIRDASGAPVRMIGAMQDISERTRTEARFRRLVEANVQGVFFWNATGEVTGANDAFLTMVGHSREDLEAGRINFIEMTPPEYAALDRRALREIAATGVCKPYEKEYVRPDGSRFPILLGAAEFQDAAGEGVCFVLDLTERKQLERQFLRSQRMESIGTLAGGIAHDLNNVLAPILMSIETLKEKVRDQEGLDMLATLQESAQRGAQLVGQVLVFARGVEVKRVSVDPLTLLRDLLKVLRETFPKSINVHFAPTAGAWTIIGDPTQLNQVFMNLCVNARDAMPEGGDLTVRVENVRLSGSEAEPDSDEHTGTFVVVSVSDTGHGIPLAIRDRILEPFFTTKELGKGTGLGLSTAQAIVKSHGGFIQLHTELGAGARFKVFLPADSEAAVPVAVTVDQPRLPHGHGEMILVVDDEEAIRRIAQRTLERFGYRVLLAGDGAQAVALFTAHQHEIALVLTDLTMPIMDGGTLIKTLRGIAPGVRTIASSGYASGRSDGHAIADADDFIAKPYTAESLLSAIQRALGVEAQSSRP